MQSCRILVLVCAWSIASAAWAVSPSIESVSPGVGQRGADFQLKLVGAGLAEPTEVMLYSPGVKCEALQAPSDNELLVQLRATADCPLGTHAFRIRTPKGISELRTFRVTPFPVVIAEEPNEKLAEAKSVPVNVTVSGVLESGDVDCFQISLRSGDRLSAEVEAIRLGGAMLDTVLTIFGPDGKVIVRADDTPLFRQDPFATIVVPVDGSYVIQIRESNFEGDENSRYALHIGTFPRPSSVYPAGGQVGQAVKVQFGGDGAGSWEQEIRLPIAPVNDYPLFAVNRGLGAPTPNPFRVSPFANVLESEPNDDPTTLRGKVTQLPSAFNGILQGDGDVDCFPCELSAGARFQFEVFAARVGSPIDTVLSILDESGNLLASNDDDETHDSRLLFTAPYQGTFLLRIAEKRGTGGANCVYRVEACQPEPRLSTFLPRPNRLSQERQAIAVPRGNRVAAMLGVQRFDVDGDIRLQVQGLPSGVASSPVSISPDRYWTPVVFEAQPDAAIAGALADLVASTAAGQNSVSGHFVQVVDLVAGSADALFHSVTVNQLAIAVIEEAPLAISLEQPQSPLPHDGTIGLKVRVVRAGDFDGPVDVTLPFLPSWVDGPAKITIPAGVSTAIYPLRAHAQAESRAWQICAEAKPGTPAPRSVTAEPAPGAPMVRRGRRSRSASAVDVAVSSQLVPLAVSIAPVSGTLATVAAEPGKTVNLVCELQRTGDLPDQLTATLEGLPNRVHAEPVTIAADDRRIIFVLKTEPTAPLGSFNSLVCRLSGVMGGQEVSYCVGRGGVLKIEPAGTLVLDDSGRALSPLEALRRSQRNNVEKE
jgi:hypothetical protein